VIEYLSTFLLISKKITPPFRGLFIVAGRYKHERSISQNQFLEKLNFIILVKAYSSIMGQECFLCKKDLGRLSMIKETRKIARDTALCITDRISRYG